MLQYHSHAERQIEERNINKSDIERVIACPDEVLETKVPNRKIAQKILTKEKRIFLYRAIYEAVNGKKLVITVYRTTKIRKYLKEASNESKL